VRNFNINDLVYLLQALKWTIALSMIAFVGGGIVGAILTLFRISSLGILRIVSTIYIQIVQGTPLLIQLFIWYFGLSLLGTKLSPLAAAGVALIMYSSAFFADIWRGSIEAIPKQQWEGAASLALNWYEQLRYVIVPQAVRLSLPSTVGFMVQIVKNTSLAAFVGFVELTRAGQLINNITFAPFPVFGSVAVLYFVLCFPLSELSGRLEQKFHRGRLQVKSA
jgi:polar amino acid transport system permease protein